ncbi:hypothetical protein H8N01_31220 [Streptomyces sp. AC536]|uniref:hypothetical protein n=1 Tax=Streptomyces buecherae TaxID=2763006 RepID=UPI00164E0E81|nr:hypothetical protein [Streptomyces buecherae]MBC3986937.1 hypothetical protein [Streptomyces buecherae]QNJ43265.1 hypothetical protein H7H31_28945 [Streptomyces buecherae]
MNGEDVSFQIPRGASGFFRPRDGSLPVTDLAAFRTALYAGARVAGGTVGGWERQTYPRTFHTATVTYPHATDECVVLCHAHHPWVAFAREDRNWYTDEFLAPPPWAHVFGDLGFTVLSRAQLTTALSAVDTSVLTRTEWRQVRAYGVTTLGGVLFNAWA